MKGLPEPVESIFRRAGAGALVAVVDAAPTMVVSGYATSGFGGDPYLAYSTDGGGTFTPASTQPPTVDLADTVFALTGT